MIQKYSLVNRSWHIGFTVVSLNDNIRGEVRLVVFTRSRWCGSVAVLGDINDDGLLPAEEEVADCCTDHDGDAQPHVIRHEDQHEEVAEDDLHHVQERLEAVHQAEHGGPANRRPLARYAGIGERAVQHRLSLVEKCCIQWGYYFKSTCTATCF